MEQFGLGNMIKLVFWQFKKKVLKTYLFKSVMTAYNLSTF